MILTNKIRAKKFKRKLIEKATLAELTLKQKLIDLNIFFQFQKPVPKGTYSKGFYIPDFTIPIKYNKTKAKLYIEVDGGYHTTKEQQIKDNLRTKRLTKKGNQVLRFTNNEVLNSLDKVIETIIKDRVLVNPLKREY